MIYNLHPIFVHFPVALLLLYSFIKIVPFSKWFPNVSWKHIERALLFFGVLGAFAALATGEVAEDLVRPDHDIVEMHSFFASLSTWLYGLLLLGEIISIFENFINTNFDLPKTKNLIFSIQKILTHKILSKIIAFFALVSIFVTGLLGGVMIYGTSADPFADIVLKILGLN